VRLVNQGPEIHHLVLVKIGEGKTYDDFLAFLKDMKPGPFPSWLTEEGGPNPPMPGDTVSVTQNLEPGTYAMVCFVDTPDRVPHVAKGMTKHLVVTPSTTASAPAPTPSVTLVMRDYQFEFTPALTAGRHVIKTENLAQQSHEFALFRLDEGKTVEDFQKWGESYQGPPPGRLYGGLAPMRPGVTSYVEANMPAGNYLVICFVPDIRDGKPHMMHGMILPVTVS
jgi:hypothetical protein